MLDVADDPDNLPRAALVYRVWVVTQQNLLPDRVFVRKEAMRKRFVHDNRPRRGLCIVIIKIAPLFQRNLEGDRKSTRLNSSHRCISYAVFCLKKKNKQY